MLTISNSKVDVSWIKVLHFYKCYIWSYSKVMQSNAIKAFLLKVIIQVKTWDSNLSFLKLFRQIFLSYRNLPSVSLNIKKKKRTVIIITQNAGTLGDFCKEYKLSIIYYKGVLRTLSKIQNRAFCKTLHCRCLTKF